MDARGETVDLDAILALDAERRALVHDMEQLRAEQNKASGEIAKAKKAKEDASEAIAAMREVSGRIKGFEEQVREKDAVLRDALLRVPNLPHDSTPVGADENANVEVRKWSEPTQFEFDPKDHVDIGTALGILDFETAARISGARFTLLRGAGARLERALIAWMLDTHADEHGYTEMLPPFLVASASMEASGQLPKFAEEAFSLTNGDYWLNPTAEVPLTSVHRDEILTEDNLPLHYVAYAPSFRSEAGSYGKDTRGMLRQHQFDKVELYKFAKPEDSWDELEALTQNAETILQKLNLPYRVMALCTGDIGFGSAKTYDLEVWLPGQDTYREISSCSNCTDFQARRANIRFRRGKQVEFVHTLNGSGLAVGRTLIAIVENYQQADGSVVVPDVLRPYMGGLKVIAAS
jgi:seryl-tRNA synthetase